MVEERERKVDERSSVDWSMTENQLRMMDQQLLEKVSRKSGGWCWKNLRRRQIRFAVSVEERKGQACSRNTLGMCWRETLRSFKKDWCLGAVRYEWLWHGCVLRTPCDLRVRFGCPRSERDTAFSDRPLCRTGRESLTT